MDESQKKKKPRISTQNKSISTCRVISIIGILIVTPIIGSISNASASTSEDSFMPFSDIEGLQQGEEDGSTQDQGTTTANVIAPNVTTSQIPDNTTMNVTQIPEATEPVPTQNQTQIEQNQSETTGAVESIQCPAPLRPTNRPIDLKSGNGPIGGKDSLNQFSTNGFNGQYNPAFIVAKESAWADPLSGSKYISSDPNRQLPASGDIWYKVEFTLPSGFKNPSLNGNVHADNQATIFLNNPTTNQIGQQTPQYSVNNFQDPAESFGTTANFITGTNTLYFRITNVDRVTGLDYNATVTYCLKPTDGGPPGGGGNVTCPANNVQHWDKIIFQISDAGLASNLSLPTESMLDIKVLDDPTKVADIEKKVLDFLNLPDNPQNRNAIFVIDVEYAIICAK